MTTRIEDEGMTVAIDVQELKVWLCENHDIDVHKHELSNDFLAVENGHLKTFWEYKRGA